MGKEAQSVRPVYKKLFIAAAVIYVIGTCMMHIDLFRRLGVMEHELMHMSCAHKACVSHPGEPRP